MIIANVFSETNYSLFHKLPGNRPVSETRKAKLMASYSAGEILCPIIVNEMFEIIDGQGRFEALKALGRPIPYIIARGATKRDCMRMNSYNEPWKMIDFINSWAESGNVNYINLLTCMERFNVSGSRALRLSRKSGHAHGTRTHDSIVESGRLIFTDADIELVGDAIYAAKEIRETLCFTGKLNDAFYNAVRVILDFPDYDHERMIKNCRACRSSYAQMASLEDQLGEFTRIYNYHQQARLHFTDYMRNKGSNVRDYERKEAADASTLKPRRRRKTA